MSYDEFFRHLYLKDRVLKLMDAKENFGGPQSVYDLCKNLRISNGSSRSVLVKLHKKGKIERIGKGQYRLEGDNRSFNPEKNHLK